MGDDLAGCSACGAPWTDAHRPGCSAVAETVSVLMERQARSEAAEREADARAVLTGRVLSSVGWELDADGNVFDAELGEYGTVVLSAGSLTRMIDVFVEWLKNPPVREIQADGTESVRWPE